MNNKVIFDTNIVRSVESLNFLGGREELKKFVNTAEIIIPDIVIEEIKQQKLKHLIKKKESFLSNPFHFLCKNDNRKTKEFNIDMYISERLANEEIPYTIIHLSKPEIIWQMKKMCLENKPPFDEKSDKGFKDAYIYFTIIEYLEINKFHRVFLVTKDTRLKDAFIGNPQIRIVENYAEFAQNNEDYFKEDYFISRLQEEINPKIQVNCIEEIWLNINDNWLIKLKCLDQEYRLEVDFSSKELISFSMFDFDTWITTLINTRNFQQTHLSIAYLLEELKYLTDNEIKQLMEAAVDNEQIYWILTDDDVKEFFYTLYEKKSHILPNLLKTRFIDLSQKREKIDSM